VRASAVVDAGLRSDEQEGTGLMMRYCGDQEHGAGMRVQGGVASTSMRVQGGVASMSMRVRGTHVKRGIRCVRKG
jgi:hypothetical protein